ncbi:MAG: alpha/beta hydrolase [Ramlibacter sp.]
MNHALDLPEREREYSPSSCIGGNYAPFLQAYAERSAAARATLPFERDLAYGPGPAQRLDLCVPAAGAAPVPLLVFIHGGYWQELSKESSAFAAADCLAAGWAFAAIGYTLAPAASIAGMALECRQALRWLQAQAARRGIDPARIVVAGSSAGAHLAAMACLRGWSGDADLPPGLPAAAVLVSGVYALEPLVGTSIAAPLALTPQAAADASPRWQRLQGFPPAIVCWGEVETGAFQRQSRDFAAAVADAGAPPPVVFEVPARNHFDVILDLATPGTALGDATRRLVAREPVSSQPRERMDLR